MNFYPMHIGDYMAHTAHLEPMEDLAYRRMIDLYYVREGMLPADPVEVAKLIRMRGNLDEVRSILKEFFAETESGWSHSRCEYEIERIQKSLSLASVGVAKRRAGKIAATPFWLTKDHHNEIADLYRLSSFLTRTTGVQYHVDHIIPLKGKTVCGLHVPWNLQVITATENLKKHAKLVEAE